MSGSVFHSRGFRTLNITADYNREAIWIEINLSIETRHMIDLLEWFIKGSGKPRAIRTAKVLNLQVLYLPSGAKTTDLKFDISNLRNQHKILLLKDSIIDTEPKFWMQ